MNPASDESQTLGRTTLNSWQQWISESLAQLQSRKQRRFLRPATVSSISPVEVLIGREDWNSWLGELSTLGEAPVLEQGEEKQRSLVLFSSNDYLGLSTHPEICRAASECATLYGLGVRSSPLVAGFSHLHSDLEAALAQLKGTEDCLLFSSGFSANLSSVGALAADPQVDVFSDELNHASIIDGARLAARGRVDVYRHNDTGHLEDLLKAKRSSGRRQLVVTDSLFSMDGDFAELKALAALRRKYGFLLAVDEAHATLVCGPGGGGAAEAAGVASEVDLHIGTLSKAVGAHGGFVACSSQAKAWLLNKGRAYVYSTALPAPVAAAALEAVGVAAREPWRRRHLWDLVERFGRAAGVAAHSPIVPVIFGSEERALRASGALLREGFHVPAIRPPTVPQGTCRLRVALSAAHSTEQVDALAEAIGSLSGMECDEHVSAKL
uniref:8-amino-7-oxononanoate synthase n=1 Tax=Tetraselmis sp. GSL018 TaxID=582737 RepID=A0A061RME3_9CHLO